MTTTHVFKSPKGGYITCIKGDQGRIFRSCSVTRCIYTKDLHSAKTYLDNLERPIKLLQGEEPKISSERTTTLKWNENGDLSAIDLTRILGSISNDRLIKCELACNFLRND